MIDAELSAVSAAPDKLIRVDAGPASYLAHVELQANADPAFDRRVLMYNAVARWRHGLPVRSVAFLLHPRAQPPVVTGSVSDRAAEDLSLAFAYRLVRVWELPVEPLLTGPLSTLPLAPVAAVGRADLAAVVDRVRRRLAAEPSADGGGGDPQDLWKAMEFLVEMRYSSRLLEVLMLDMLNPSEGTAAWDLVQRGLAEGLAAGRVEGRGDGVRQTVLRLASDRFGPPSPAVLDRLQVVATDEEIDRVVARLLTAADWADLLAP